MFLCLLAVSLIQLASSGELWDLCGDLRETHTLTQVQPNGTQSAVSNGTHTIIHPQLNTTYIQLHIIHKYTYICRLMATPGGDPPRDPERNIIAPRAIQLTVKYPSFNWEGNTYEQYKTFKQRVEILMDGPYEDYKEPDKVAAILGWLGDKGHQVYASIDWPAIGKNKKLYKDVLGAFELYFKPMQTVMHSWYQLGNLYSSQCKDQTEFMTKLKELSKDTGFKETDELAKFLFVIHNTDTKVREYLIDKGNPSNTCQEFLQMARSVESMVKTETLSRELLGQGRESPSV